ncbi:MAG: tripartite tricarboxylate transporter TctB family protein [Betaproteobacteria bacterium]
MTIKSQKDFFSGLLFMAAGVTFAWLASGYTIGHGAQMGPGYFPLVLGLLLALLGTVVVFKALVVETVDGQRVGPLAWRPVAAIVSANVVFGICLGGLPGLHIPALGLVVAVMVLVLIASSACTGFKPTEVVLLAGGLATASYVTLDVLLKLPISIWPVLTTG